MRFSDCNDIVVLLSGVIGSLAHVAHINIEVTLKKNYLID